MAKDKPTIAEERIAKQIAFWHGQTALYYHGGRRVSVSDIRDQTDHGWAYRFDHYVDKHWEEYLSAARAILEARNEPNF